MLGTPQPWRGEETIHLDRQLRALSPLFAGSLLLSGQLAEDAVGVAAGVAAGATTWQEFVDVCRGYVSCLILSIDATESTVEGYRSSRHSWIHQGQSWQRYCRQQGLWVSADFVWMAGTVAANMAQT